MDKKIAKLLYTLIMKDVDIATLSSKTEETMKIVSELKTKITENFKMVSDITSTVQES